MRADAAKYIPMMVLGCLTSSLSVIGSLSVIYMTSRDCKRKIVNRLLLGLSIADFVSSSSSLVMPFSIPSELRLPGAVGNHASCTTFGFFLVAFGKAGCCYNTFLSVYYFLVVRKSWREQDFNPWLEALAHTFAFLVPLSVDTVAAATQSINPFRLIDNICVYAVSPMDCSSAEGCDRSSPSLVNTFMAICMPWLAILSTIGFACTFIVYLSVRKTIRQSNTYNFTRDQDAGKEEHIRQVAIQAVLYCLAYMNSAMWPTLAHFLDVGLGSPAPPTYWLQILYWAFYPLQGFFNFFIFTRRKRQLWKQVEPNQSTFWIYQQILQNRQIPKRGSTATMKVSVIKTREFSHPESSSRPSVESPAAQTPTAAITISEGLSSSTTK